MYVTTLIVGTNSRNVRDNILFKDLRYNSPVYYTYVKFINVGLVGVLLICLNVRFVIQSYG